MTWEGGAKANGSEFDLDRALAEIKAAGYDAVEMGGDQKKLGSPQSLLKRLASHGLTIAAFDANVTANPWPPNTAEYRRHMDYASEFGVKIIMVCGGFIARRRNTFDSDYAQFAENLAAAQAYADRYQQKIAFHPHVGCIVETQAEVDRLLRFIPGLNLCIDTGHLAAVRCNPISLLHSYSDKILHVHLKDWDSSKNSFAELGTGDAGIDFKLFLSSLCKIGYTGSVSVERDSPQIPPIESARISRAFLSGLLQRSSTEISEQLLDAPASHPG
jgi:inosose dehydratase